MKRIWLAIMLFISTSAASAEVRYYDFLFRGFEDVEYAGPPEGWPPLYPEPVWNPNAVIGGSFRAEDLNGNHTIEQNEVSSLVLGGRDVLRCSGEWVCEFRQFYYEPGRIVTLEVDATRYFGPWQDYYHYHFREVNAPSYTNFLEPINSTRILAWTENTTFTIISSVPEPSAPVLLLAGLGVLAGTLMRPTVRRATGRQCHTRREQAGTQR